MPNKIRVLIADDHEHERRGLIDLLRLSDSIEVIGEATSAQEAVEKALELRPHVVLLDLAWNKDRTAGSYAIRQIKEEAPEIKILVMTAYPELIESAKQAGADMASDKDNLHDLQSLANRIRDTYQARGGSKAPVELTDPLSDREQEVLELLVQGQSNHQIAQRLSIADATVKHHVSSIIAKFGVRTRAEVIAQALSRGIVRRKTAR